MVNAGRDRALPLEVARAFTCDVALYFTEQDVLKRDEIAARQRCFDSIKTPTRRSCG
jgi:hypothetical protein